MGLYSITYNVKSSKKHFVYFPKRQLVKNSSLNLINISMTSQKNICAIYIHGKVNIFCPL